MLNKEQQPSTMNDLFLSLLEKIGSPYALKVWHHARTGKFQELQAPNPKYYQNPHSFAQDYLAYCWASKSTWIETTIDKKAVAIDAFLASERRCSEVNRKFRLRKFSLRAEQLLSKMSRKIVDVIGPYPPGDWADGSGWGPGATSSVKNDVALDKKMLEKSITTTNRAYPYVSTELGRDLHWARARGILADAEFCPLPTEFSIVDSNRVVLVPKSYKTDRTIAAEPTANIFLQKAVGNIFRRKLKRVGINLDDQTINQRLAAKAYSKSYCTIDLSAASDSMCRELIFDLLPIEWANLLDALRSPKSKMPTGKEVVLEKFSSMGNGFTFELESLIFFAAASAVCDEDEIISVFGDDIIVPAHRYKDLVWLLNEIGFEANLDKSYSEGNFYESCGAHYFKGVSVLPIYQKSDIHSEPQQPELAANRFLSWFRHHYGGLSPWELKCRIGSFHNKLLRHCKFLTSETGDLPVTAAIAGTHVAKPAYRRGKKVIQGWAFKVQTRVTYHAFAYARTMRFGSDVRSPFKGTIDIPRRGVWVAPTRAIKR